MIRVANAEDISRFQLLRESIIPFNHYTPNDIKETYVYEDNEAFGFLCTTSNMKHIVAVGGTKWHNLIRYFYYCKYNEKRRLKHGKL